MAKVNAPNFDPRICMGTHPSVDGPCPRLAEAGADTGRPIVDRLAGMEHRGLEAVGLAGDGQPGDFKCGACGCPLPNLGAFRQAPDECPRLRLHR